MTASTSPRRALGRRLLFALACLSVITQCLADGLETACRDLITNGLKEYAINTDSSSYLSSVFDRYCESSGSEKTSGFGLGLDIVVKAIPVGLRGTYSSNEEALRNFCKNYVSRVENYTQRNDYQEHIVERAYESFEQCAILAQSGVIVRHKVRDFNDFDFFIAPGFSHPVTLQGIKVPPNVVCEGQDPTLPGSPKQKFDMTSHVVLSDNRSLNIACTRSGTPRANGERVFEEATVTLLTNIPPSGNYSAYLPKDAQLPEDQASVLATRMNELRQDNETMKQALAAARSALLSGTSAVGGLNGHHGRYLDATVKFVDAGGNPFEFKTTPHVVVVADRGSAEDEVSWSATVLSVSNKEFIVRLRSVDPTREGNFGWNGALAVQWVAYAGF